MLPTSFVPQEDQGYAMVAIIMPQAASLERTQAVAERADAILAKIPGVDKRSMITGYSLVDAGFKTNVGHLLHHLQGLQGTLRRHRDCQGAERARHPDGLLRPGQAHPGGGGDPDRAAGHPRHRHHRRLRVLDPGHRRRLTGGAGQPGAGLPGQGAAAARAGGPQHHLQRHHPAAARRRRPREGDAAAGAGAGRLQRHPGAVRLADRQPVQPVQPRVVGDRAVRRAVPPDSPAT